MVVGLQNCGKMVAVTGDGINRKNVVVLAMLHHNMFHHDKWGQHKLTCPKKVIRLAKYRHKPRFVKAIYGLWPDFLQRANRPLYKALYKALHKALHPPRNPNVIYT